MSDAAALGSGEVPIRDAATVALLRDGPDGIETWLLTRVLGMAFAPGMCVFPGGRVDEADAQLPIPDAAAAAVATRFGDTLETARKLIGAAVRETFEETGVLLTQPRSPDLSAAREDIESGRASFGDLLAEHGLRPDVTALAPWAHWITPVGEPRRYDARFFLAALPAGARARDLTSESVVAGWVRPADGLADVEAGRRSMMPPTLITLRSLVPFATVQHVLAAAPTRQLMEVRPRLVFAPDGSASAELPDGTVLALPKGVIR
jgi:8-oxo-dGTP pyrophosphatase MutT (NUDIX family)